MPVNIVFVQPRLRDIPAIYRNLKDYLSALVWLLYTTGVTASSVLIGGKPAFADRAELLFINKGQSNPISAPVRSVSVRDANSNSMAIVAETFQDRHNRTFVWFIGNVTTRTTNGFGLEIEAVYFEQQTYYAVPGEFRVISRRTLPTRGGLSSNNCTYVEISESVLAKCKAITTEGGIYYLFFDID